MNNDDRRIAEALQQEAPEAAAAPRFDDVFGRAEAEFERRQRRRYMGVAGAVASVAAVAIALLVLAPKEAPESLQITGLLDSTSWVAPSDVLLPEHEFDIFEELPEPTTSTESAEGALL